AVALEAVDQPVHDPLVEVFAAEVRVAGGREHFEQAVLELEDGDVERAAAEVVDGDELVLLVVQAVRQRRRRRLVDDAQDFVVGPTSSDSYLRPIRRLMAKTVLKGLVMACRLAICPTRRSLSSVKPTTDGVVRLPSRLGITCGVVTSTTATQELVVPRSMPM